MSNPLNFPTARQPVTEKDVRGNEVFTRPWALFFQQVYERVGGAVSLSSTDLAMSLFEDAGTSETNAVVMGVEQAVNQSPPRDLLVVVDSLLAELSGLRDQLAELTKEVESIKQGAIL